MISLDFWWSSVVHLCVCAGGQRGRERVSERWGVHWCSVVLYVACASLRPTHGLDPALFLIYKKSEARIVRAGDVNSKKQVTAQVFQEYG